MAPSEIEATSSSVNENGTDGVVVDETESLLSLGEKSDDEGSQHQNGNSVSKASSQSSHVVNEVKRTYDSSNEDKTSSLKEIDRPPSPITGKENEVEEDAESVLSFGDNTDRPKVTSVANKMKFTSDSSNDEGIRRPKGLRPPLSDSDAESLMSLDRRYPVPLGGTIKKPTLLDTSDSTHSSREGGSNSDGGMNRSCKTQSKPKVVKKMTKKQRDEVMKEIKSKTERMKREAPLKLPYHRPEVPALNEFLERRNRKKIDFQTSLGPKFKLKKCIGGLGNNLDNGLIFESGESIQKTTQSAAVGAEHNLDINADPLCKINEQIPFSSKVDDWMKTFENKTQTSDNVLIEDTEKPLEMDVDVTNPVEVNFSEPNLTETKSLETTLTEEKTKLCTIKLEKINVSDSDDNLIIDEENVSLVDLTESEEIVKNSNSIHQQIPEKTTAAAVMLEPISEAMDMEPLPGPSKNLQPNRFEVLETELNEYYSKTINEKEVKTQNSRRRITDLLKSQPNHDELLQMKPKIMNDFNNGFFDLSVKGRKPTSQEERGRQILLDRFMKHTAVQKKPREQHFTLHVTEKEEDSQGKQNITVNKVDYVQYAKTELDENEGNEASSPSPGRQPPGARLLRLREGLIAQIRVKKKIEYVERMKKYAMDNEEKCLEDKKIQDEEEEEEEIMEDEDMTESETEPEITDDEELENIRQKDRKHRKKKSAFVDDEAEDDDAEGDEDVETKKSGDNKENDDEENEEEDDDSETDSDLISIKSSEHSGLVKGDRKFQRVIRIDDSSDEDVPVESMVEGKLPDDEDVAVESMVEEKLPDDEDVAVENMVEEKLPEIEIIKCVEEEKLEGSQDVEQLEKSQSSSTEIKKIETIQCDDKNKMENHKSPSSSTIFKSWDEGMENSSSFNLACLKNGDNGLSQDMFSENTLNGYNTDSFSQSLSISSIMPLNWRTPKRTPAEIENLFNPQITPVLSNYKFSGQIDSQRQETPSPVGNSWIMPRLGGGPRFGLSELNRSNLFKSPIPSLFKVNSEQALDYFIQDNVPSTNTTPNLLPKEITKLFDQGNPIELPFGNSKEITPKMNENSDLMALCSGIFPTQAPATPEESQQSSIEDDYEDNHEDLGSGLLNKTPNNTTVTTPTTVRAFPVDNETPKMGEKVMRTTRLFLKDNNSEVGEVDEDEEDKDSVIGIKIVKKRKRRLEFSDDELDEVELDDQFDEIKNKDEEEEMGAEYDEELMEPEYDDEENEILRKSIFKGMVSKRTGRIRKEFVDAEAELSGSELGSGDEDERGLDYLDEEEGDAEKMDEEQLRDEVGKAHFKQLLDDDQRQVRLLQEAYLEHGDLHTDGKTRERQFRWKNIDDIGNDDIQMENEGKVFVIDEVELQRQNDKLEKVKWMKENSHLMDSDEDENDTSQNFLEDSQFLKIRKSTFAKIQSTCLQSDNSMSMSMSMTSFTRLPSKNISVGKLDKTDGHTITIDDGDNESNNTKPKSQPFFPSPEDPFSKIRKGSFLSRGSPTLSRLAEMTKINDTVSNVKNNSRNFVFATITPPSNNSEGNHSKSKKPNGNRRATIQPKKIMKIDRSFSSMDCSSKEASIFKWF